MKKPSQKITAFLLLLSLLGTVCLPARAAAPRFPDVPASSWAAKDIARAVDAGLFEGRENGTFGMGQKMTRASFVTVLGRLFAWKAVTPASGSFADNQARGAWYYGAVETALANGALTLQSEHFRPADFITREEMAVMIVRALGYETLAGLASALWLPFRDVTCSRGYLALAYNFGILGGTSPQSFSPELFATREQAAVALMRVYDRLHTETSAISALTQTGALPEGATAAVLPAVRLVRGKSGAPELQKTMTEEKSKAIRAQLAEKKIPVLLQVTGEAVGSIEQVTALLKKEVADGGYDGVQLALHQPNQKATTHLVQSLREALGKKLIYVLADAPSWREKTEGSIDFAAVGKTADRVILRVEGYEETVAGFPIAPLEPVEEIYYALARIRVPAQKISLQLTSGAGAWRIVDGKARCDGVRSTEELARLLKGADTHYAERYEEAYLTSGDTVLWYHDDAAIAAREQLLHLFGVTEIQYAPPISR